MKGDDNYASSLGSKQETVRAEALSALLPRIELRVYRYLLRCTEDKSTAEDLRQEVFRRLLKRVIASPLDCEDAAAFDRYVLKTSKKTFYTYLGQQGKNKDVITPLSEELVASADAGESHPDHRLVLAVFGLQNPVDRLVIFLHYFGQLEKEEVAALVGRSTRTINRWLERGYVSLAASLVDDNIPNPWPSSLPSLEGSGVAGVSFLNVRLPKLSSDSMRELFTVLQVKNAAELKNNYMVALMLTHVMRGFEYQLDFRIGFIERNNTGQKVVVERQPIHYYEAMPRFTTERPKMAKKFSIYLENEAHYQGRLVENHRKSNGVFSEWLYDPPDGALRIYKAFKLEDLSLYFDTMGKQTSMTAFHAFSESITR